MQNLFFKNNVEPPLNGCNESGVLIPFIVIIETVRKIIRGYLRRRFTIFFYKSF